MSDTRYKLEVNDPEYKDGFAVIESDDLSFLQKTALVLGRRFYFSIIDNDIIDDSPIIHANW